MTDPSIADPPSPYSPALVAKPAPVVRPVAARTKLLLEGPIFATLLRLAAPNILNLIAFVAVIIFDGLFLGRIGTDALAGVSWPSCFCGRRKLLHAKGKKQSPLETSVQRLRSTRFCREDLRMDRSNYSVSPPGLCGQLGFEAAPAIARRARLVSALLAAALFACVSPAARALEPVDIGRNPGAAPAHFDFLPASEGKQLPWALFEDATAAGGIALEQRSTPTSGNHFLAVYKSAWVKDAEISVCIKATGGEENQGGGIALRLMAPDSYYVVQMDARRDRVAFLRVAGGDAEEIVAVDADIANKAWHTLTVRAVDDEFVVSLDGAWAFTAFDKALSRAGRVALWTPTDSVTRFDSITIAPPSPSAQQ